MQVLVRINSGNACEKSYSSERISQRIRSLWYSLAVVTVPGEHAVKGNIKNEGLAMVQDPSEPKNRGGGSKSHRISISTNGCDKLLTNFKVSIFIRYHI